MSTAPHRLVTGPLAALEPALVEHVFAIKAEDRLKPVVILVGETLLRPYLRRRIAGLGGPHINVHVLTPAELGLRLGERRMILAGRRPLPVLAGRILAHEAAQSGGGGGGPGYFAAVRDTPGFAGALHRTLSDLQRAGLSPPALLAAGAELPEREKIAALAALAARHDELRAGHYDADAALAAADAAELPADQLLVYGLWEAPATLRRAIAAVARACGVTVYLPTAHAAADQAHAALREWLERELGAGAVRLSPPAAQTAPALRHVQRELASPPSGRAVADDGSVHINSAPDPSREVRAALRACLGWAREGIALHEMAIAYRHADPYRPLLSAIAREAGLPIYDHQGTPLGELPVGRRTLALLDLLEVENGEGLDRGKVIAFAADNRLPETSRDRYAGSSAQWDRISRRAGVVRGHGQWRERLAAFRERTEQRYGGADEEDRPTWVAESLAQIDGLVLFVDDLAHTIAQRPANAPWSEHVAHLEAAFGAYLTDSDPILDAVRALTRLDPLTATVSAERFLSVVRNVVGGLRSTEVEQGRAGAFRARGINVLDVNSLRQLRFRAVCVLGLAERAFPPAPRQDPLLLDDEREALGLPLRARGADPEPLQFALAVQAAEERLLLSHPRTEHGSARPLIASSFLRAAAETLAGERIPAESLPDRPEPWLTRLGADRVGAPALEQALDPPEYDRTLLEVHPPLGRAALAARQPNAARGRAAWMTRLTEGPLSVYEGGLSRSVLAALAAHPRLVEPMSPSALETFADCPMRFFLSRVLGLRELDEPEEIGQITPLARGGLMHRVLERVTREWLPGDPPSAQRRAAHLARLAEVTLEECAAAEAQGITGYPALWAAERDGILLDLRLWYEDEVRDAALDGTGRRFGAADFEVGFGLPAHPDDGPQTSQDPLLLTVGDAPLRFHGRIDRLEWDEPGGRFRVIDYKTGKLYGMRTPGFDGGRTLQLPLYLLAAADVLLRRDGYERGSAQYFYSTRKGTFARVELSGDLLSSRWEDFERIVGGFSSAIADGSFPARPDEWKCKRCDFRSLCPAWSDHEAIVERRVGDPRVADLRALAEIE